MIWLRNDRIKPAAYSRLWRQLKSVRHGSAVPDGFQRAIRCGDRCSSQLPSRWRKANGNDCIRNSCMAAFSEKCQESLSNNHTLADKFLVLYSLLDRRR